MPFLFIGEIGVKAMVQAGQQTRGTISKNKNNARIKAMRDARAAAVDSRQKYKKGVGGIKRRGE